MRSEAVHPLHQTLCSPARAPSRDAKRTHFRKPLEFDRNRITEIESELAQLIGGGALVKAGETEVTITEEWV